MHHWWDLQLEQISMSIFACYVDSDDIDISVRFLIYTISNWDKFYNFLFDWLIKLFFYFISTCLNKSDLS